jgi:hypothetical protein
MIDTTTHRPIHVSTDGDAGPYIMVPFAQLACVKTILDRGRVSYWVDAHAISLDGKPEIAIVNLGRGVDATQVQRLLDAAA